MKKNISPLEEFQLEKKNRIQQMQEDKEFLQMTSQYLKMLAIKKYMYDFTWLGVPIIQFPTDIVAIQELIWTVQPDLVIETGIAHGGSIILSASILEMLGGNGHVVGIDIDIRKHNRDVIEHHPMMKRITMIEGSSIAPEIVQQVTEFAKDYQKILVILDSCHTHEHVLSELEAYAPLVSEGSYLIVFDTFVEELPSSFNVNRPWDVGNNPMTALNTFLPKHPEFIVDTDFIDKLLLTCAPKGWLKKVHHN